MNNNILLKIDAYKHSHSVLYRPGTTYAHSYLSSRGGRFPKALAFGFQMLAKDVLTKPFTKEDLEYAVYFNSRRGVPYPAEAYRTILNDHGGYLPIQIRAVDEGTLVPAHNALLTVESTDERFPWITGAVETMILRGVWYPTTVATLSYYCRKILSRYVEKSCDNPAAEMPFKLHDFGARGVSSGESAEIGGCAHMVSFQGSDTDEGVDAANRYYGGDDPSFMAGFSIPATEHGPTTSWGPQGELGFLQNFLTQYAKPGATIAAVSDTYDIYNAVTNYWCRALKDQIIASGATVVVRPDSGDPVVVVPEILRLLEVGYGSTINHKGYRVLNHTRVIQGDGITHDTIAPICDAVLNAGFSLTNVNFGMGGGLLQMVNRDTLKMAYKLSLIKANGVYHECYKDPITDPGKRSMAGYLDLIKDGDHVSTRSSPEPREDPKSILPVVFKDGELLVETTMDWVRKKAWG